MAVADSDTGSARLSVTETEQTCHKPRPGEPDINTCSGLWSRLGPWNLPVPQWLCHFHCGSHSYWQCVTVTQKLPLFVYQFYPYANYPHMQGYKLTYFGMAWNRIVTMFGLWRCTVLWGHWGGNALDYEVMPTLPWLWTWPALAMTILIFENWILHLAGFEMQSIRPWTGNTADKVGAEPVRATDSESDEKQCQYAGIH